MSFMENLVSGATGGLLGLAGSASTNAANKEINEQNIAMQRETNQKNEQLMRESWGRDDTAIQRRTKDLVKAGMSPLLAAGAAASNSGPVSMSAPQSKQIVTKSGLEGAISGIYQGMMTQMSYMDMMAKQQQIQINQGNLAIAKENQENMTAESHQRQKENDIALSYSDRTKLANLLKTQYENLEKDWNIAESKRRGLRTNDTLDHWVKRAESLAGLANDAARGVGQIIDKVNDATGRTKTINDLLRYSKEQGWKK